MFGMKGLQAAFLASRTSNIQTASCELRDSVRHFEAGHPPSDDLTILLLEWNGYPLNAR